MTIDVENAKEKTPEKFGVVKPEGHQFTLARTNFINDPEPYVAMPTGVEFDQLREVYGSIQEAHKQHLQLLKDDNLLRQLWDNRCKVDISYRIDDKTLELMISIEIKHQEGFYLLVEISGEKPLLTAEAILKSLAMLFDYLPSTFNMVATDEKAEYFRTIKEAWDNYNAKVLPKDASRVQRAETMRAFYGGAAIIFGLITALGDDSYSEDEGADVLDRIESEIKVFQEKTFFNL